MSDISDSSRGRSRDHGRRERPPSENNFRDRSRDRGREPKSMKPSANRVYVANLPFEYRWQDIKDLFRKEVGEVAFVELFYDDINDRPKGSGIVEFVDAASVEKCLDVMQYHEVNGRKLFVKQDSGMRDRQGELNTGGGSSRKPRFRDDFRRDNSYGNDGNERKWGNTYGLSINFLESFKIEPPLGTKVFVAGLRPDVSKRTLKNAFHLAGKILKAEIPVDKEGRSRGFGIIEYEHPVEAVQAISMFHNQSFFDHPITVRMDKAGNTFRMPEGFRQIGMGLGPKGEPLKNVALSFVNSDSQRSQQRGNSGASGGMMGNASNNMPFASSASGVGSVGGPNPQVLQTGNLSGMSNNLLGNTDLSSIAAAAANAAAQQLAALTAQNVSSNLQSSMQANLSSPQAHSNFGRHSAGGRGGRSSGGSDYNFGSQNNEEYHSVGGNNGASKRDDGDFSNPVFTRTPTDQQDSDGKRRIMVSNLPPNVSYKLLSDKFSEYGDVMSFNTKPNGCVLLTYATEWQAERAIKNLDKARVTGRLIEARFY